MMMLKVTKNKALHSLPKVYCLKYILRVKTFIFVNETLISNFAEFAIFHSISISVSLEKVIRKMTK